MIPKGFKFKIGDVIQYGTGPRDILVLKNMKEVESWDLAVKNKHNHSCTVVDLVPREVPQYHVGYANVYRGGNPPYEYIGKIHSSTEEADKRSATLGRIARLRIEFMEGQIDD